MPPWEERAAGGRRKMGELAPPRGLTPPAVTIHHSPINSFIHLGAVSAYSKHHSAAKGQSAVIGDQGERKMELG